MSVSQGAAGILVALEAYDCLEGFDPGGFEPLCPSRGGDTVLGEAGADFGAAFGDAFGSVFGDDTDGPVVLPPDSITANPTAYGLPAATAGAPVGSDGGLSIDPSVLIIGALVVGGILIALIAMASGGAAAAPAIAAAAV